mgnify:CR=1 FL=1
MYDDVLMHLECGSGLERNYPSFDLGQNSGFFAVFLL